MRDYEKLRLLVESQSRSLERVDSNVRSLQMTLKFLEQDFDRVVKRQERTAQSFHVLSRVDGWHTFQVEPGQVVEWNPVEGSFRVIYPAKGGTVALRVIHQVATVLAGEQPPHASRP